MHSIQFEDAHRQKHFDFFKGMNHPHFNFTVQVPFGPLLDHLKRQNLPFTPSLVYWMSRVANELKPFRWRLRDDQIVEHDSVQPSFTVKTQQSEVFSFCTVDYHPQAQEFIRSAQATIEAMQNNPSFEDEQGRDDYLFMSAIPWFSFTSCQHAMSYHPSDSVPRITWGKYFEDWNGWKIPVSVQVHHALVDGSDMGKYFQLLEGYAEQPERLFS
ncbi:MAG: CatA-like O-acetyltransferase [Bacteroidota bacterium]